MVVKNSFVLFFVFTDNSSSKYQHCFGLFHRSSWWMSPRGMRLSWRPKSWRRKIGLCSIRKVWWRLLQGLQPRATQPLPSLASWRSAKSQAAPRTRSNQDPGCPLQRNKSRHPHTDTQTEDMEFMRSTKRLWNQNCVNNLSWNLMLEKFDFIQVKNIMSSWFQLALGLD